MFKMEFMKFKSCKSLLSSNNIFQGWGEIPRRGVPSPEASHLRGGLDSRLQSEEGSRICSRWRGFYPLYLKAFSLGPFLGILSRSVTNHLLFILHLYLYLSLVSSLWALIFIQYLLFIEKYIYRNQMYFLLFHGPVDASQIPLKVREGCP